MENREKIYAFVHGRNKHTHQCDKTFPCNHWDLGIPDDYRKPNSGREAKRRQCDDEAPLTSIVIRNHNGLNVIERCLSSVLETSMNGIEVIVVDDASSDSSPELVKSKYARLGVKLIELRKNVGPAAASNLGVKMSRGKYIAFLDNDTKVEPDWLNHLIDLLERNERVSIVQPSLFSMSKPQKIDSIGHELHVLGYPIEVTFFASMPSEAFEVFGVKQAAMVIRRAVFEEIGGFDEDYFFYFEESDLCWRSRLLGYTVVVEPRAKVYHIGGYVMGERRLSILFHREKNTLASMIKNYSIRNLTVQLAQRMALNVILIVTLFLKKRVMYGFTMIKAVFSVIRNLRKLVDKRIYVQRHLRKVDDENALRNVTISNLAFLISYLKWRAERGKY